MKLRRLLVFLTSGMLLHAQIHLATYPGVDPTGSTDSTEGIQNAFNQAGLTGVGVYCDAGNYKLSTVSINYYGFQLNGPGLPNVNVNGCHFIAETVGPMITHPAGVSQVIIQGIFFDSQNIQNQIAIYLNDALFWTISNSVFESVPAGGVAIKSGGSIAVNLINNIFTLNGMAWDMQNAYASNPTGSYYGCNVCFFDLNYIGGNQGARSSGMITVSRSIVELTLNSGGAAAALQFGDPVADGDYTVTDTQFDLTAGTAPLIGIQVGNGWGTGTVHIERNWISGSGNTGTAINLAAPPAAYIYGGTVKSNLINQWTYGINYVLSDGAPALDTDGNVFGGVTYPYEQPTARPFGILPACNAGWEGQKPEPVSDSTTATFGDAITGGGTHHVLAYCDGTHWTVMAK